MTPRARVPSEIIVFVVAEHNGLMHSGLGEIKWHLMRHPLRHPLRKEVKSEE